MKRDLRGGMKAALRLAFVLLFLLASACSRDLQWADVLNDIRTRYPDVRQITTDSLTSWLADSTRVRPILLDTRAAEEYSISHIAGAVRVDPEQPNIDNLGLSRDAALVTYCSVGDRSSAVTRALQEAGYTNVANLEGSLFKWANEGRPMVGPGGVPTRAVHEYDAAWGKLLE